MAPALILSVQWRCVLMLDVACFSAVCVCVCPWPSYPLVGVSIVCPLPLVECSISSSPLLVFSYLWGGLLYLYEAVCGVFVGCND